MTREEYEETLSEVRMLFNYEDKEELAFLRRQEMQIKKQYREEKHLA